MVDAQTRTAISATLHCLSGCAVGEVLGMVIGTALNWHNLAVTLLAVTLAFVFGYSFTVYSVRRHGLGLRKAISIALAADTLSIATMEIVDNGFIWLVPGAVHASLVSALFWWSLLVSLGVAFVLTVPVNRWLIARGKGHAAVHEYHAGHHMHE
jgi:hypothetical protein